MHYLKKEELKERRAVSKRVINITACDAFNIKATACFFSFSRACDFLVRMASEPRIRKTAQSNYSQPAVGTSGPLGQIFRLIAFQHEHLNRPARLFQTDTSRYKRRVQNVTSVTTIYKPTIPH